MHLNKPMLGTQLDWSNPLNDGLVLHLALNEGHGDKVQDLSLNGNHGTLNNFAFPPTAASGWNPGQTGIGLISDGVDDYIACPNRESLNIIDAITISIFVKWVAPIGTCGVLVKDDAGVGEGYGIYARADGKIKTNMRIGATWEEALDPNTSNDNFWHNFVSVYDGTTIYLYRDGIEVASDAASGSISTNTHAGTVGRYTNGAVYLAASTDQPRIQSRAWSAKEVRDYAINPWQVYLDEND